MGQKGSGGIGRTGISADGIDFSGGLHAGRTAADRRDAAEPGPPNPGCSCHHVRRLADSGTRHRDRLDEHRVGVTRPDWRAVSGRRRQHLQRQHDGVGLEKAPDGTTVLLNGEFNRASGNLPLPNGDLLQAEWSDNRIYRISPDGSRSIFAEGGLDGPVGIVQRPSGDFIVANSRGEFLARIPPEGGTAEVALRHAEMTQPNGVAIDSAGNIYVSDLDSGNVFKWMHSGEVVVVATLPGSGNAHAAVAGGALYVNKIWDHVIYRVELDTWAYGIVTGTGRPGYEDGPVGVATIEEPNGIAANAAQDVIFFNTQRGTMGLDVADGLVIVRRLILPN